MYTSSAYHRLKPAFYESRLIYMFCSFCSGIARHSHVSHCLILGEPGVVARNLTAGGINSS